MSELIWAKMKLTCLNVNELFVLVHKRVYLAEDWIID